MTSLKGPHQIIPTFGTDPCYSGASSKQSLRQKYVGNDRMEVFHGIAQMYESLTRTETL
jgi:hypothetical protein